MKTEVVTVSSYFPKEPYYRFEEYKKSIRRFGVEPTILGFKQPWHGLMTKPRLYREFLRKGQATGDVLVVTDAWDILFAAHPDEIGAAFMAWPGSHQGAMPRIIFNAERNCFPRGDLAGEFDKIACGGYDIATVIPSPWRYLNSGFMVGTPKDILTLLESMDLDSIPDDHQLPDRSWFNPNDQEHFTLAFLKQPVPMKLDYQTELCMAAHGSQLEELDFTGPRIKNKITGTEPMVFHLNGSAKNDIAPSVLDYMKL